MKILILTCSTGGGHDSAAIALKDYFENHNVECDVADFLSFGNGIVNDIICNGHVFIYRHAPRLFNLGYKISELDTKLRDHTFIYKSCSRYAENLYEFLLRKKYDCIVSVHVFASLALDYIIKNLDKKLVAYNVSTDYTCYPEISNTNLTTYFIAHNNLTSDHTENGVSADSIVACGIPIKDVFYNNNMTREQARDQLDIPLDKKLVVIAGGSMGAGPIEDIASSLLYNYENDCYVSVICGSNDKLYEELEKFPELILYHFVDNMDVHMRAADILITKAGGLSITEAAAMSLPMVFINAVSGCEGYNRDFFDSNGYALASENVNDVVVNTGKLLNDEELYNIIKANLKRDFSVPSQEIILNHIQKKYVSE